MVRRAAATAAFYAVVVAAAVAFGLAFSVTTAFVVVGLETMGLDFRERVGLALVVIGLVSSGALAAAAVHLIRWLGS